MEFEDDPAQAASNLKKHKVSFEEAASVFGDPMTYTFADPDHSIGEERWLMFGRSRRGRILAVIYTYRGRRYRIISARVATRHERKIYEEG
jgi:uncharacterized DUF497 family protein